MTMQRRQLVVCCDGTNNSLTGHRTDTNVLRLYEHLATHGGAPAPELVQQLYYDPGVGVPVGMPGISLTERIRRRWDKLTGLAEGRGIYENVAEAYLFLVEHWQPGSEIYIFGFSRGAFTARCVAGMVNLFGLIRPEQHVLLPIMLRIYFSPESGGEIELRMQRNAPANSPSHGRHSLAEQIRTTSAGGARSLAAVRFIGVWDTVASVGMGPFALRISAKAVISGKRMAHVRQALALDEHRWSFEPRLYSESNFGGPGDAQSLRQCWFRGVHSDVGGGYAIAESGLANDALRWMIDEARACGLRCAPLEQWQVPPGVEPGTRQRMHDALYGDGGGPAWWALAGMTMRDTRYARGDVGRRIEVQTEAAPQAAIGAPPPSVWDRRRHPGGWLVWLLLALLSGAATAVLLAGEPGTPWSVAYGQHVSALLQALFGWVDPDSPRSMGWLRGLAAVAMGGVFVLAIGAVLSRPLSRAYARLARVRMPGAPVPVTARLGLALPLVLGGQWMATLLQVLAALLTPAAVQGDVCADCGGWLLGSAVWLLAVLADVSRLLAAAGLVGAVLLIALGGLGLGVRRRQGGANARPGYNTP